MALTESTKVDLIEVIENGSLQIRTTTTIYRDEQELSKTHHRHVKVPGSDVSAEDSRVQAIANAVWTEEVISAYQQSLIANNI